MKKIYITLISIGLFFSSCEEYLEQTPVDQIGDETVVEDLASLEALVLGMYSSMQAGNQYGELQIFMSGILSDEMVFTGTFPTKQDMSVNNVTAENVTMRGVWSSPYTTIFIANTVIERAANATDATDAERAALVAEAKFARALCHLNLVKFWGAIPLAVVSDVNVTSELPRSPVADVYAQIIADLTDAVADLPNESVNGTDRATVGAANALLARAHLYNGNLASAGAAANAVITSGEYSLDTDYANIFDQTASSPERIFQMFSSIQDGNNLGFFAQPPSLGGRYDYSPSPALLAAMDAADTRANLIVASPDIGGVLVTNKYTDATNGTDNAPVLRLAEMYLIRAEANSSVADLNTVAERATGNAAFYGSYTEANMLQERMFELAFEGHRWHDIIRTGTADGIMSALKPASWNSTDILLPIPQRELDQNPTLTAADQNSGY